MNSVFFHFNITDIFCLSEYLSEYRRQKWKKTIFVNFGAYSKSKIMIHVKTSIYVKDEPLFFQNIEICLVVLLSTTYVPNFMFKKHKLISRYGRAGKKGHPGYNKVERSSLGDRSSSSPFQLFST